MTPQHVREMVTEAERKATAQRVRASDMNLWMFAEGLLIGIEEASRIVAETHTNAVSGLEELLNDVLIACHEKSKK